MMTEKINSKLHIALAHAAEGRKIFPIRQGTKNKPLVRWGRGGPKERATDDLETINVWWTRWPHANIGIATGPSNLLVLDLDVKDGRNGEEALAMLDLLYDSLPPTRQVRTQSGGRHLIYRTRVLVKNAVDFNSRMIGSGIDVRSDGGMVVAAGSETEKGRYEWINPETPIAKAPEWLVELSLSEEGRGAKESGRVNKNSATQPLTPIVPLEDDQAIARAISFLEAQPPAVEDGTGENHTYRTACEVKDYGISESKCLELLLKHWNDRCDPPWKFRNLQEKVDNAYNYGKEPPGVLSPVADFDAVEEDQTEERLPSRFLNLDQIQHMPPVCWLIEGLLPEGALVVLYGPPGSLKTFVAIHAGLCVANGTAFLNREVAQGPVFYLAGENPAGFRLRIAAWKQHHGYTSALLLFFCSGWF